ncbi:hypothetical protein BJX61DRAFT_501520 [Aspergillus egyptiacus]|nr:hypothetical protein BJX61DRAFT_501520 [Aspergillus egyptiacus]
MIVIAYLVAWGTASHCGHHPPSGRQRPPIFWPRLQASGLEVLHLIMKEVIIFNYVASKLHPAGVGMVQLDRPSM